MSIFRHWQVRSDIKKAGFTRGAIAIAFAQSAVWDGLPALRTMATLRATLVLHAQLEWQLVSLSMLLATEDVGMKGAWMNIIVIVRSKSVNAAQYFSSMIWSVWWASISLVSHTYYNGNAVLFIIRLDLLPNTAGILQVQFEWSTMLLRHTVGYREYRDQKFSHTSQSFISSIYFSLKQVSVLCCSAILVDLHVNAFMLLLTSSINIVRRSQSIVNECLLTQTKV